MSSASTDSYPWSITLSTTGGSGSGAVTYAVANGTATGCADPGGVLTATTAGTCTVTATKATDGDYTAISSAPQTVTFTETAQATLTVSSASTVPYPWTVTLATTGWLRVRRGQLLLHEWYGQPARSTPALRPPPVPAPVTSRRPRPRTATSPSTTSVAQHRDLHHSQPGHPHRVLGLDGDPPDVVDHPGHVRRQRHGCGQLRLRQWHDHLRPQLWCSQRYDRGHL